MNIGMVLDGFYPADIRVRKEAEALVGHSHNVAVLCAKKEHEPSFEIINGVRVFRRVFYKNTTHKGVVDIVTAINFIHPLFKKELSSFIEENNIAVLHVHDLPLAKTVYVLAKKYNLKTVLDLHENYPEALLTWFSWRKNVLVRLKNAIFFGYRRWSNYESKIIKKYDIIIVVVDEMKAHLQHKHSWFSGIIVTVTNSEKKDFSQNFKNKSGNYFPSLRNNFILSYVGGFGPHRGLQTAIIGFKNVIKKIPNAILVLIGPSNQDVLNHLLQLVKNQHLENHVLIRSSIPFDEVISVMKSSSINLIPHISNSHTDNTIPHKLFQILQSGKPILVSDCKPMKRIIEENSIGTIFKAGDSEDFAKKVIMIHEKYENAMDTAKKGVEETVDGNLNWEHTSKELIKIYDDLSV